MIAAIGDKLPDKFETPDGRVFIRTNLVVTDAGAPTGSKPKVVYYEEECPVRLQRLTPEDFKAMMNEVCEIHEEDYEPFGRLSRDRTFKPDRGSRISQFVRPVGKAQRWIQLSQRVR